MSKKELRKYTIAFLYNVRHSYPDPDDPRSQLEADFDDPGTIEHVMRHLKNCGCKVLPIEANEYAYDVLLKNRDKIDLAFNFSEGMYGEDRYAHIPAILEMLRIPYTGSSPLTQGLVLHKARMKDMLRSQGVPTPASQLFVTGKEKREPSLLFPLIVKPVSQGSSAGITQKSVVKNDKELRKQVQKILTLFGQPVLVEPFLTGKEFSVALLGNPPKALPIIEPDHSLLPQDYLPFDSLEVKWVFEEASDLKYLMCPAKISKKIQNKIESIAFATWNALAIRDWCRIDMKMDANGAIFVLDVNSPAGLMPPEISTTSYFPLAARAKHIEYEQLLSMIISIALKRYGIKK